MIMKQRRKNKNPTEKNRGEKKELPDDAMLWRRDKEK